MSFIELTTAEVETLIGICNALGVPRFGSSNELSASLFIQNGNYVLDRSLTFQGSGLVSVTPNYAGGTVTTTVTAASNAEVAAGSISNKVVVPSSFAYGLSAGLNSFRASAPLFSSGFSVSGNSYFNGTTMFSDGTVVFNSSCEVSISGDSTFSVDGAASFNPSSSLYLDGAVYSTNGIFGFNNATISFSSGGSITAYAGTTIGVYDSPFNWQGGTQTFSSGTTTFSEQVVNHYYSPTNFEECNVQFYSSAGDKILTINQPTSIFGPVAFFSSAWAYQQSPISNASDATNVITRVNAILGVLRTFGFIST